MESAESLLVFTTLPDTASAQALAEHLVGARVAACVSVQSPCRSVYRWQGQVERADEVPLLIKTTASRYAALEAEIRARHPYAVPEIVALPIQRGLPDYLAWLATETDPTESPSC